MVDTEEDQQKIDEKFDDLVGRGFSPEEIADMEKVATDGSNERPLDQNDEINGINNQMQSDDFFRTEASENEGRGRFGIWLKRNRGKTTIGLGAILLGGGGFGLFAMLAGPLQFIQIARLLQGFHFTSQEDLSDDRMMKIARYVRYRQSPEKLRLGFLGNKYANSIERRMNKSGLESAYDRLGYGEGYIIDPNRLPPGSELEKLKAKTPEELRQKLATNLDVPLENIDLDRVPGKVVVSTEGLGYFKNRKLLYRAMRDSGYSKIGSAIRSRIMAKRAGLNLHPIRILDRKILKTLDARLAKWTADREGRLRNGTVDNPTIGTENTQDTDGDGKADAPADDARLAAEEANKISQAPGDKTPGVSEADAKVANARSKLTKAAGVTAVAGLVCLIRGIADKSDALTHSNVVLPLMRIGGEVIAVGNQLMTGQDIDVEVLGELNKKLYSEGDGSWAAARSIQAELDKELTGIDIGDEAQINNARNALSRFFEKLPGLSGLCSMLNSTIGQIITTGIDLITGPGGAIAGRIISETLGTKLIDAVSRWIAGHPIDINVNGANYGNYINYGAKLAANDSIIASGGVELTPNQTYELKKYRLQSEEEQLKEKSFFARLFDPTDVRSVTGSFMSSQSPDPAQNIARAAKSIPSSMASIFKLPLFGTNSAKALSDNYDYGFPSYGFSVSDINNELVQNPFENARIVEELLNGSDGDDLRDKSVSCFGVSILSDGSIRSVGKVPAYYEINGKNCEDTSEKWLRTRFFILDTQLMEAYACYENDNTACSEFGL